MFQILQTVTEASENSDFTDRVHRDKGLICVTANTSIHSILKLKKEREAKICELKAKIRKREMENTNIIRNVENFKRKENLVSAAKEIHKGFQEELEEVRFENFVKLEMKKLKVKFFNRNLKENLERSKEGVVKKNSERRASVLKERKENEDYIRRRENYYLNEKKEMRKGSTERNRRTQSAAMNRTSHRDEQKSHFDADSS